MITLAIFDLIIIILFAFFGGALIGMVIEAWKSLPD